MRLGKTTSSTEIQSNQWHESPLRTTNWARQYKQESLVERRTPLNPRFRFKFTIELRVKNNIQTFRRKTHSDKTKLEPPTSQKNVESRQKVKKGATARNFVGGMCERENIMSCSSSVERHCVTLKIRVEGTTVELQCRTNIEIKQTGSKTSCVDWLRTQVQFLTFSMRAWGMHTCSSSLGQLGVHNAMHLLSPLHSQMSLSW